MDFSYYLGIDISKNHIDLHLCNAKGNPTCFHQCRNTPEAIREAFQGLPLEEFSQVLICAEQTGMYSFPLIEVAEEMECALWLEDPTRIILSSGVRRGKSDPVDAARIAAYAHRFADQARLYRFDAHLIRQLKYLMSTRRQMVADRAKYIAQLNDQKGYMPEDIYADKQEWFTPIIDHFSRQITQVEARIRELLHRDTLYTRQIELMQSIPGVGPQLALGMLTASGGFTTITSPKAMACHAGVAPFAYHSGENDYTRSRVSHRADKQLKCLLHMAALSVVARPGELQDYYRRKCAEGKPKMSVLNAIRCKLIHRIYAVIKRNEKYIPQA